MSTVTPGLTAKLMADMNIVARRVDGEPDYDWSDTNGNNYSLRGLWGAQAGEGPYTELMAQCSWSAEGVEYTQVDEWNETNRFGRMYLSEDEVFFEMDMVLDGGVRYGAIKVFMTRFMRMSGEARGELGGMN